MTAFTDSMETLLLDHIFRNTDYTRSGTLFVALHTADPTEVGTTAEVTGNAYARQPIITGVSSAWTAPSGGTVDNSGTIEFPAATPAEWGTITHVSVHNAVTSGTALFYGTLTASKVISASDIFRFDVGDLNIAFD